MKSAATCCNASIEHNDALVGRFYAAQPELKDWMRILSGRPPIPPMRAFATLLKYEMGIS